VCLTQLFSPDFRPFAIEDQLKRSVARGQQAERLLCGKGGCVRWTAPTIQACGATPYLFWCGVAGSPPSRRGPLLVLVNWIREPTIQACGWTLAGACVMGPGFLLCAWPSWTHLESMDMPWSKNAHEHTWCAASPSNGHQDKHARKHTHLHTRTHACTSLAALPGSPQQSLRKPLPAASECPTLPACLCPPRRHAEHPHALPGWPPGCSGLPLRLPAIPHHQPCAGPPGVWRPTAPLRATCAATSRAAGTQPPLGRAGQPGRCGCF